ncbi:hypothetical protein [Clostridium sp. FP1]|uniref:hypothetical protein n=1 Tax=Clostridium sp. FP1 TaxID=2724076 RepID=UPI0013E98817|nr:hypothetical protein [Clostridium sp. FP1]MBZ9634879.1 hypothetical protein [Clostridium sp. FP1]
MEVTKDILNSILVMENKNIESGQIINFPIDNTYTSWMTKSQKKLFEVLKNPEHRNKTYKEILFLAGYKGASTWHIAIKNVKFADLLENMGVKIRITSPNYLPHGEIEYIKNPKERETYLTQDIWDVRKLYNNYPRHKNPADYILNFAKIKNINIRNSIKKYFNYNQLSTMQPTTVKTHLDKMSCFLQALENIFPNINSFNELKRESHIEKIISNMHGSATLRRQSLTIIKSMFKYMYDSKWVLNVKL